MHSFLTLAVLMVFALPLRAWSEETVSDEKKPAVVVVHLPADAELVIGGVASKRQTTMREFDTPPLTPGKKFSYVLKAAWKTGVKEVTHVRTIYVTCGVTTTIDLRGTKPKPALEPAPMAKSASLARFARNPQ